MSDNRAQRRESRTMRAMHRLRDLSEISPCYKYTLFLTNFMFLLAGVAMIAIGAYVLDMKDKTITYFVEFLFDPSCLLCLAGSITAFSAFLGCSGALRENTGFIQAYYWVLSIVLLLQVIFIIFVFIFYFMEDVATALNMYPKSQLLHAIIRYRKDNDLKNVIDALQESLGCCGASSDLEGFRDWNANPYFNCTGVNKPYGDQCSVPYSCCIKQSGDNINYHCGYGALMAIDPSELTGKVNTKGCLLAIKILIIENVWIIGGILFGVLIPQAIFICMAKTLYDQVIMQKSKW